MYADWINEVVKQRFDELAAKSDHLSEIVVLDKQLRELEGLIGSLLAGGNKALFNELLDLHTTVESMKKEWIYVKGVQDGMKILTYLLKSQ